MNDVQIEKSAQFWTDELKENIDNKTELLRFKKTFSEELRENNNKIITLNAIPHSFLEGVLKKAKLGKYSFPFRRIHMEISDSKVFVYQNGEKREI